MDVHLCCELVGGLGTLVYVQCALLPMLYYLCDLLQCLVTCMQCIMQGTHEHKHESFKLVEPVV